MCRVYTMVNRVGQVIHRANPPNSEPRDQPTLRPRHARSRQTDHDRKRAHTNEQERYEPPGHQCPIHGPQQRTNHNHHGEFTDAFYLLVKTQYGVRHECGGVILVRSHCVRRARLGGNIRKYCLLDLGYRRNALWNTRNLCWRWRASILATRPTRTAGGRNSPPRARQVTCAIVQTPQRHQRGRLTHRVRDSIGYTLSKKCHRWRAPLECDTTLPLANRSSGPASSN
jgi:hypothetical protein